MKPQAKCCNCERLREKISLNELCEFIKMSIDCKNHI